MRLKLGLIAVACSGLLAACGGGGGGGNASVDGQQDLIDRVSALSGIAEAKGLVITGEVLPRAGEQRAKAACSDENGDMGETVTINGQEFCQADLRSETLYAVDENGILVRVLYLDEAGDEVASESFRPQTTRRIEDNYIAAAIQVENAIEGTGEEVLFARLSDGAIFNAERWTASNLLSGSLSDRLDRLNDPNPGYSAGFRSATFTDSAPELFLTLDNTMANQEFDPDDPDRGGLFRAELPSDGERDLVARELSPSSQFVIEYTLLSTSASTSVSHALYGDSLAGGTAAALSYSDDNASGGLERGVGSDSDILLLDLATGGITPNPAVEGYDLLQRTDRTYEEFNGVLFRFRGGETVLGGLANYGEADNDIAMYELAVDGSGTQFVLSNPTVAESPAECRYSFLDAAEGPSVILAGAQAGPFGTYLAELGDRTLTALDGNGRCIVEVRLDAPVDQRIAVTVLDNLVLNGFVVGAQRQDNDPSPVLFTDSTIYALGRESGNSQDVIYAYDRGAGFAATRLNFDGFLIQDVRPFANNQIVVEATDTSNGDPVVLVAGADGTPPREVSRDSSVQFVTLQRLD